MILAHDMGNVQSTLDGPHRTDFRLDFTQGKYLEIPVGYNRKEPKHFGETFTISPAK
jgi:hypothetical protein